VLHVGSLVGFYLEGKLHRTLQIRRTKFEASKQGQNSKVEIRNKCLAKRPHFEARKKGVISLFYGVEIGL
jgi:hypothetical protein